MGSIGNTRIHWVDDPFGNLFQALRVYTAIISGCTSREVSLYEPFTRIDDTVEDFTDDVDDTIRHVSNDVNDWFDW